MEMKRFIISILVSLPILFSSCSDYLDRYPVDSLSPETFWKTEDDAHLAMVGCYNLMEPIYGGYNLMYWDCAADNLFNYFSWEGYKPIANGEMTASNAGTDFFKFLDIRTCNEYLANEANIAWVSPDKQSQYKAEVRTMRAMFYFWKTEQYGDYPFFTEVIASPEEALLPRTAKSEIRDFIVSELKECIPLLPNKKETVEGRINKQSAQAMLMRTYLYEGDYAAAREQGLAIQASGEVAMPDMSYADAFLVTNQYNSETILDHSYLEGTSMKLYLPPFMPNMIGGWSSVVPTADLVDAYEMADGRTIEEAKATGDYKPANPFVNRDPRLRATILYPGQVYDPRYASKPDGCYNPLEQFLSNGDKNDDYWANADNASKSGLQCKKFMQNLSQFGDINSVTTHVSIFRYAEVLLTIAECDIELGTNTDEAIACINEVRKRAGMPNVDRTKYNNPSSLRDLVRRERRVEFAGEGLRRGDLKRWDLLTTTLSGFKIMHFDGKITKTVNAEGDYDVAISGMTEVGGQEYKFKKHNVLLPISQTQMDINTNLKQNEGY